jgi:hypothetical protein
MSLAKKAGTLLLFLVLPVLAVGCGGGPPPTLAPQNATLAQIHQLYEHYIKNHQKAPSQMSDLAKPQYEGIYPVAVAALKQGKFVIVWGVNSKDSGTVLAYEKDAPTKGGAVLMADGSVKDMTAEQLKAAQKS